MKITVTVLDTTGIQPYIFGSNRLRENIGASYLVAQVTDNWVRQELRVMGIPNPESSIEGQDAELVYAGGGNTVLLFKSHDLAKVFTQKLSFKVLNEAPGINLVIAHREIEWDQDELHDTVQDLMANDLDVKKRSRIPSSPLLGLGVTADCQSTRLVAVDRSSNIHNSPGDYLVSREIVAKLEAVPLANQDLKKTIFDPKIPNHWDIPRDFDEFGRSKGEMSYIAVVHIDGNSMGEAFKACGKGKSDREYIKAVKKLSSDVKEAGRLSLKQLTQELIYVLPSLDELKDLKPNVLPFRPLVYGGDDITFVCDGRLGLSLAARYLQLFEEKMVIGDGAEISLTACAGVCIVKAHYPFARAYNMSEELCKSAKRVAKFERKAKNNNRSKILSAIDWHITSSGLLGGITEIREREYRLQNDEKLEMRPLLLNSDRYDWQTWESFSHIIKVFEQDKWKNKQNKVKALREVLRRGEDATKEFLAAYKIGHLPELPASVQQSGWREMEKSGWHGDVCGYFDAIEAIDFYLPLQVKP